MRHASLLDTTASSEHLFVTTQKGNNFTHPFDSNCAFITVIYKYYYVRFLMKQQIIMNDKHLKTIGLASIVA